MNNYDDFAIISPDKMEKMAREYALEKNNARLLKENITLHNVKSTFNDRDLCYSYIQQAYNNILEIYTKKPNKAIQTATNNIRKIKMLFETFFNEYELHESPLTYKKALDEEIVFALADLTIRLLPIAKVDTIQEIIILSIETIKLAIA